jgi:hypothetical protein
VETNGTERPNAKSIATTVFIEASPHEERRKPAKETLT